MGLCTSHGCWQGSYTGFHAWRQQLANLVGIKDLYKMRGYGGEREWDRKDVLTILLDHSDSDGEIAWQDCGPLADRLQELLPSLPSEARGATERFIAGLRKASSRCEAVDFH